MYVLGMLQVYEMSWGLQELLWFCLKKKRSVDTFKNIFETAFYKSVQLLNMFFICWANCLLFWLQASF